MDYLQEAERHMALAEDKDRETEWHIRMATAYAAMAGNLHIRQGASSKVVMHEVAQYPEARKSPSPPILAEPILVERFALAELQRAARDIGVDHISAAQHMTRVVDQARRNRAFDATGQKLHHQREEKL